MNRLRGLPESFLFFYITKKVYLNRVNCKSFFTRIGHGIKFYVQVYMQDSDFLNFKQIPKSI